MGKKGASRTSSSASITSGTSLLPKKEDRQASKEKKGVVGSGGELFTGLSCLTKKGLGSLAWVVRESPAEEDDLYAFSYYGALTWTKKGSKSKVKRLPKATIVSAASRLGLPSCLIYRVVSFLGERDVAVLAGCGGGMKRLLHEEGTGLEHPKRKVTAGRAQLALLGPVGMSKKKMSYWTSSDVALDTHQDANYPNFYTQQLMNTYDSVQASMRSAPNLIGGIGIACTAAFILVLFWIGCSALFTGQLGIIKLVMLVVAVAGAVAAAIIVRREIHTAAFMDEAESSV